MSCPVNDGLLELNPARHGQRCATVITGVARSGTSMAARVLHGAGMHLGDCDDVVFECRDMARHLDSGDPAELRAAIAHRMSIPRYRWGFKRPNLHSCPIWPPDGFADTRLVLMVRDPVSTALRAGLAHDVDPVHLVEETAQATADAVAFALHQTCPVLLVGYEKAIAKPQVFVRALTDFAGWPVLDVRPLLDMIEPERPHYLRNARA